MQNSINTNEEAMSSIISRLRKLKGMTQRDLAERLGVTDKAVSKWERGLGYPDIKILPELAKELGVTSNELLGSQKEAALQPQSDQTEQVIRNTLNYADHAAKQKIAAVSKTVLTAITIFFLVAILASVICDIAVTKTLSWSLYVISSTVFTWFLIAPLLCFKKYKFILSLTSVSILTIPLLSVIEQLSHSAGWLIPIGIPCTLISLVYLWGVCLLFTFTKINRWYLSSIAVTIIAGFQFIINAVVDRAIAAQTHLATGPDVWDYFSAICILIIAVVLFLLGKRSKKRI